MYNSDLFLLSFLDLNAFQFEHVQPFQKIPKTECGSSALRKEGCGGTFSSQPLLPSIKLDIPHHLLVCELIVSVKPLVAQSLPFHPIYASHRQLRAHLDTGKALMLFKAIMQSLLREFLLIAAPHFSNSQEGSCDRVKPNAPRESPSKEIPEVKPEIRRTAAFANLASLSPCSTPSTRPKPPVDAKNKKTKRHQPVDPNTKTKKGEPTDTNAKAHNKKGAESWANWTPKEYVYKCKCGSVFCKNCYPRDIVRPLEELYNPPLIASYTRRQVSSSQRKSIVLLSIVLKCDPTAYFPHTAT